MTQHDKILNYLDTHDSITPMDAFSSLRITKLSTRISEMRKLGINFGQELQTKVNDNGETVRFMRYWRDV